MELFLSSFPGPFQVNASNISQKESLNLEPSQSARVQKDCWGKPDADRQGILMTLLVHGRALLDAPVWRIHGSGITQLDMVSHRCPMFSSESVSPVPKIMSKVLICSYSGGSGFELHASPWDKVETVKRFITLDHLLPRRSSSLTMVMDHDNG